MVCGTLTGLALNTRSTSAGSSATAASAWHAYAEILVLYADGIATTALFWLTELGFRRVEPEWELGAFSAR